MTSLEQRKRGVLKVRLARLEDFADEHTKYYKQRYVKPTDRPLLTEVMTLPTPTLLIV